MNVQMYLHSKGYGASQMMINGQFNLTVHKEGKVILRVSAPPNVRILEQDLFNVVKSQIEIYEEELNEVNKERASSNQDSRCEEVCSTAQESEQVSQLNSVSGQG